MIAAAVVTVFCLGTVLCQDAPPGGGNAAFVEALLRGLRDVHDTRESRTTPGTSDREQGVAALHALRRSSEAIVLRMDPWRSHPSQRIRDLASYLLRAGRNLEVMAALFDELLNKRGEPDPLNARIRREREALEVMMLSIASVGAAPDSSELLPLDPEDKQRVVRLIEESLFVEEMKPFPSGDQEQTGRYPADPEVFAVLALRNLYHEGVPRR